MSANATQTAATSWNIDPVHTTAEFKVKHMMIANFKDPGIAGVDVTRLNAEGKAVEHWHVLQEIGDPKNAAYANGMF